MLIERKPRAGGGFPAVWYTIGKALEVGPWRLWRKMRSANACKTCALGMGGQMGGMVNEAGRFPEVCKKSLQAQVADMKGAIGPEFFDENDLDALSKLTPKEAEDCGRLVYPLVLHGGSKKFIPISWEAALASIAAAFSDTTPERAAFYSSGRSSNEAAFLLQSFARVWGSTNINNCSYYCHQASGVALKLSLGTGTATVDLDDLDRCDMVVLVGANPASNHPRLMTKLAEVRGRGGRVIVINPLRERGLERFHVPSRPLSLVFGTEIASDYLQPLSGGDVALFVGVLKALAASGSIKQDFLQAHVEDAEAAIKHAEATGWPKVETDSGIDRATIEKLAADLAGAKAVIFAWAMGLTHHVHGVDNILALTNVALATGNIGRPGAGMMPIRGHSNVQGIGSIGFSPAIQDGLRTTLERLYGKAIPQTPGLDTFATIEAAKAGNLDLLFCLGGNLWGSNPDSQWAAQAMQNIPTTVYLSTKLNPGHFHGRGQTTFILPVLARDEETQSTTQESMFNYVRLSDGGTANVEGSMRAESDVICDLANRVMGTDPVDWNRLRNHDEVRKLLAQAIPGWEEIADIGQTKKEFTITGRILHEPQFPTATGRAKMHKTELPKPMPGLERDALRLMTLRSEGQFNTVVYETYDLYRGVPHRHCILIAAEDATRLGLADGQRVTVTGEAGSLSQIEVVIAKIKAGVAAMYYPEANVLIKCLVDERSRTPAFKSCPVWIKPVTN